jgi:hypothetical protein
MTRFLPVFCCGVTLLLAVPAHSQTTPPVVGAPSEGRVAEWMYGEHIPAIPGKPFSSKVELEMVNQLPDGTLITHTTYNIDARDLLGRTRNEARNWINPSGEEPILTRIELYDPATRMRTNLFPLAKLATQWAASTPSTSLPKKGDKSEITRESLGEDVIEGIPVRGTRVTQVYPTGTLGNDRPLTIVTESWFSQDLKIALLTKRADPRYGVQTVRVTELLEREPEASLFAIPENYKVTNVTPPGSSTAQTGQVK